jgi:sortase A
MDIHTSLWPYRITLFVLFIGSVFYPASGVALAEAPPAHTAVPSRLIIPGINLDSQVTPVGRKTVVVEGKIYQQWDVADDLVSWHDRSAKVGEAGNTVLNGHSDTCAEIFRNLKDVRVGDLIVAFAEGKPHYYVVTERVIVKEKDVPLEQRLANARWIAATDDERLTLVTCIYPGATHRLIVIAQPLDLVYGSG